MFSPKDEKSWEIHCQVNTEYGETSTESKWLTVSVEIFDIFITVQCLVLYNPVTTFGTKHKVNAAFDGLCLLSQYLTLK